MVERLIVVAAVVLVSLAVAWAWPRWRAYRLSRMSALDIAATVPVVLAFTAHWCGQCRLQQRPILRTLEQRYGHLFVVREVDVGQYPELASRFGVLTLPTTVVVAPSGRVVARNSGVAPVHTLLEQIQEAAAEVGLHLEPQQAYSSVRG